MCLSEDVGEAATQGSLAVGGAQPAPPQSGWHLCSGCSLPLITPAESSPVVSSSQGTNGHQRQGHSATQQSSSPKWSPRLQETSLLMPPGKHKTGFPVVTPCSPKGPEGTRTHQKSLLALTHQSMVPQTSSRPSQSTSVPPPHFPLGCHPRSAPPRCPLL